MKISLHHEANECLFTEEQIQSKIKELAEIINTEGKSSTLPPVLICVLNGSFMFFSDLLKKITILCEIDFIRVKSYNSLQRADIVLTKDIEIDLEERNVWIIDDIFDSGETINFLLNHFSEHNPRSLNPMFLLWNQKGKGKYIHAHYGFATQGQWVYGYGMDLVHGMGRNLPAIYCLPQSSKAI
jgi:hypoxanthine phosphoribosyltransferase